MAKKLQRKVAARPAQKANVPAKQGGGDKMPLIGGRSVSPAALCEFTNQLAVLLDAGIPITKCLRILEGQMKPGALRRAIAEELDDVEGGTSLSESLGKHPSIFDELYTNMIRAGEAGGAQEEILNRLSAFMEKAESIKSRVKGALAYPVAVCSVALLVLVLVFIFVIPKFKEIFIQQFGTVDAMPKATKYVINTGEHLQGYWWAYLIGMVLLFILHKTLAARVFKYRWWRDTAFMKIPIFGMLITKSLVGRFSRTFGTLIQSGVPHLSALEIVGASLSNVRMTSAVDQIHSSIREGAGIAVPMGESGMFDDLVINMIDVGEQTGELDRMLSKIADRYEIEVDRTIDTTFKVLETVLIVVLAVVVGFIVYALFAPLLTLMQSL